MLQKLKKNLNILMSILSRPGWVNRAPYHPADQQRLIAEARVLNIVKQAEQKFLSALKASGHSRQFMGSPQAELYKFVGQIVINTPELAKYFPDVKAPRHLKSSHIARLATIEGGDQSMEQLQSAINDTFDDIEKFKTVASELHAGRRAKSTEEVAELGVIDKREKLKKWREKDLGDGAKPEKPDDVEASEEEIERAEDTGHRIANLYGLGHAVKNLKLNAAGETLDDVLREDDTIRQAYEQAMDSSSPINAFLAKLEAMKSNVADDIIRAIKARVSTSNESIKLTAHQTDQLLQEQRVKARQHRFQIDERYGR